MLDVLVYGTWGALVAYALWFLVKARTVQPLTLDDLALTWKVHKQKTCCKASRIDTLLTKNKEVVGFRCDCGYEFLQRRLITQKVHNYTRQGAAYLTPSKAKRSIPEAADSLRDLGLRYSYIKEI